MSSTPHLCLIRLSLEHFLSPQHLEPPPEFNIYNGLFLGLISTNKTTTTSDRLLCAQLIYHLVCKVYWDNNTSRKFQLYSSTSTSSVIFSTPYSSIVYFQSAEETPLLKVSSNRAGNFTYHLTCSLIATHSLFVEVDRCFVTTASSSSFVPILFMVCFA